MGSLLCCAVAVDALISYKNAAQYEAVLLSFWASNHGGHGTAAAVAAAAAS
jgi:hypothetical protein